MLFSIGRSATRSLASTALIASSTNSTVFRTATKVHFRALRIYGRFPQTVRGLTTATRSKKASPSEGAKSTTTKKPAQKQAAKKPATKAPVKARATPRSQAKAKPKSKAKPKPKARKVKKPISVEQKAITERRALKAAALFDEPKTPTARAWNIFVQEKTQGKADGKLTEKLAPLAQEFKALPSSEVQRLKSKGEQSKVDSEAKHRAWVESHSPQEIHDANLARKQLKRKYNYPRSSLKLIRDERLPKRALTAYVLYTKARWASGDFATGDQAPLAASAKIGQEWKSLTPAERKPYADLAQSQLVTYHKAVDAVLTRKRRNKSPSP